DKAVFFGQQAAKIAELNGVAERFQRQLLTLAPEARDERIAKGADYFLTQLTAVLAAVAPLLGLDVDNKETKRQYDEAAGRLRELLNTKTLCLDAVSKRGFSVDEYLQVKTDAILSDSKDEPRRSRTRAKAAADSDAPSPLIGLLTKWRAAKADELNMRAFAVLHQKTLLAIARQMPASEAELLAIDGIGKQKLRAFGREILDIVADYREAYGIEK
nr:HRDC domain-containing protein [Bacteroidales bacterium]